MKLIIGLGNPGEKYAETRHNVGFLFLEWYASQKNAGSFEKNTKFNANITETVFG